MLSHRLYRYGIILVLLCALAPDGSAQSFDLRPQTKSSGKSDDSVLTFLEKNDVSGMRAYLKANKRAANSNSRVIKSASGAKVPVPLFYDAVSSALSGEKGSAEMCKVIIDAGCDLHPVFDGKTPIYLLMDYFATHKKSQCGTALKILEAFDSRSDWDANQRYRSELPPMNYLIRTNYEYLGQRFSKEYISDDVLKILISHGASVTSYTGNGQTLMTFAIDTDNQYLQRYFVEKGVNLTHQDDSGHDDFYRMIDSGNLASLQEAYRQGRVTINVNTVKNNARDMARYKELYDFVTGICAEQARSYEDICLFRSRFADKALLVNDKYESMARAETNAATDFVSITNCEKRFPDLQHITSPKKRAIGKKEIDAADSFDEITRLIAKYPDLPDLTSDRRLAIAKAELSKASDISAVKQFDKRYPDLGALTSPLKSSMYSADCSALETAYTHAKDMIASNSFSYRSEDYSSASRMSVYQDYYDPDNQCGLGRHVDKFYRLVSSAQESAPTISVDEYFFQFNYDYFKDRVRRCHDEYQESRQLSYGLDYPELTSRLSGKYDEFSRALSRAYDKCHAIQQKVRSSFKIISWKHPSGELEQAGIFSDSFYREDPGEITLVFDTDREHYFVLKYGAFYYRKYENGRPTYTFENYEIQYYFDDDLPYRDLTELIHEIQDNWRDRKSEDALLTAVKTVIFKRFGL